MAHLPKWQLKERKEQIEGGGEDPFLQGRRGTTPLEGVQQKQTASHSPFGFPFFGGASSLHAHTPSFLPPIQSPKKTAVTNAVHLLPIHPFIPSSTLLSFAIEFGATGAVSRLGRRKNFLRRHFGSSSHLETLNDPQSPFRRIVHSPNPLPRERR